MTIQEAEEYYKRYLGHGFHMCREEPGRYNAFKNLDLPEEYFRQWDNDLLEREFGMLWTQPGRTWIHHSHILEILFRSCCDREAGTARLLDEMEKMGGLSLDERTLIIETMAGRNSSLKDGGCWLICTKTGQTARMKTVMEQCFLSEKNGTPRYNEAVMRYRDALRRFSRR